MNGTCQCGGRINERSHTVETLDGANNHGFSVYPIEIETSECKACGRCELRFFHNGKRVVNHSSVNTSLSKRSNTPISNRINQNVNSSEVE